MFTPKRGIFESDEGEAERKERASRKRRKELEIKMELKKEGRIGKTLKEIGKGGKEKLRWRWGKNTGKRK